MDTKYCLDTNVLIQAWQKYYSPDYCPEYWMVLNQLGLLGRIFIPKNVYDEIIHTDDELSGWLKASQIPVSKITESVIDHLKCIYETNPDHARLVDSTRERSLADPWVIAHAIDEAATVVTKESKVTAISSKKIKIPNVCENMGIKCIDDFQFIRETGIVFSCKLKDSLF